MTSKLLTAPNLRKLVVPVAITAAVAVAGFYGWQALHPSGPGEGFTKGNGRIEATEIDVAAKLGGRIDDLLVEEGDYVAAGQVLAHMQLDVLEASKAEAAARYQQALTAIASAEALVTQRLSDQAAAQAVVAQRESEAQAARQRLTRSDTLSREGASSVQEVDDDRARVRSAEAAVAASRAQVAAAGAGVEAAKAQVTGARATAEAAQASVARIEADISDSQLKAPRAGRIQYRIAQAGEVVGAGGRVLNLVDLSDVYMTFFVPEATAGRLALGSDVRIVLDAAPGYVIPAKVAFVASTAQFTPKSVETQSERQKLMFRVKARIDPALLQQNLPLVKTGLPGEAWVKTDPLAQWPENLRVKTKSSGKKVSL